MVSSIKKVRESRISHGDAIPPQKKQPKVCEDAKVTPSGLYVVSFDQFSRCMKGIRTREAVAERRGGDVKKAITAQTNILDGLAPVKLGSKEFKKAIKDAKLAMKREDGEKAAAKNSLNQWKSMFAMVDTTAFSDSKGVYGKEKPATTVASLNPDKRKPKPM